MHASAASAAAFAEFRVAQPREVPLDLLAVIARVLPGARVGASVDVVPGTFAPAAASRDVSCSLVLGETVSPDFVAVNRRRNRHRVMK